jgi:hypothetical protein
MKTAVLLSTLALAGLPYAQAQEVEPYGNMTDAAAVVFRSDVGVVRERILMKLAEVEGIELDRSTHQPVVEISPFKWNVGSSEIAALDHAEQIVVWWTPHQPPPQKVSGGGRHLKALRSTMFITIASLKGHPQATVVCFTRHWVYHGLNHIPHTEIPFFWGDTTQCGSYLSDRAWLEGLVPSAKHTKLEHVVLPFDPEALEALRSISIEK